MTKKQPASAKRSEPICVTLSADTRDRHGNGETFSIEGLNPLLQFVVFLENRVGNDVAVVIPDNFL